MPRTVPNQKTIHINRDMPKSNEGNFLLIKKENCLYEEERRLFYVALTRTKNYVYLFVDKSRPSIFIKELFKTSRRYIEVLDL